MGFILIRLFDAFFSLEEVRETGSGKKRNGKTGAEYLGLCADILCKCAYNMCREFVKDKKDKLESKELKEACAAVKEAAAVINAIEKNEAPETESIRIIFENNSEYAE